MPRIDSSGSASVQIRFSIAAAGAIAGTIFGRLASEGACWWGPEEWLDQLRSASLQRDRCRLKVAARTDKTKLDSSMVDYRLGRSCCSHVLPRPSVAVCAPQLLAVPRS